MGLFSTLFRSLITSAIVLVIIWAMFSFKAQLGTASDTRIIDDTQADLMGWVRLPSSEQLPIVLGVIGVVFLLSLLFHHKRK